MMYAIRGADREHYASAQWLISAYRSRKGRAACSDFGKVDPVVWKVSRLNVEPFFGQPQFHIVHEHRAQRVHTDDVLRDAASATIGA